MSSNEKIYFTPVYLFILFLSRLASKFSHAWMCSNFYSCIVIHSVHCASSSAPPSIGVHLLCICHVIALRCFYDGPLAVIYLKFSLYYLVVVTFTLAFWNWRAYTCFRNKFSISLWCQSTSFSILFSLQNFKKPCLSWYYLIKIARTVNLRRRFKQTFIDR